MMKQKLSPDFSDIDTWVFDLDNTLYPSSCNLFAQVDAKMTDYVSVLLDIPHEVARNIQKKFYHEYGTTLKGLMDCYQINPDEFLNHVHDIDYSWLEPNPHLAGTIEKLEGRKIIFTNGSRRHAENALERLGLSHNFEDIFDIKDTDYTPKPKREPYEKFLQMFSIEPRHAAMFEDLDRNLEVPFSLGMRTVLIVPEEGTAPQKSEHIDFITNDLQAFLEKVSASQ